MSKQDKTYFEMDLEELRAEKTSEKANLDDLTVKFNNKTVKTVLGVAFEAECLIDGEKVSVSEFIETDKFESVKKEIGENYGLLATNLFGEKVSESKKNALVSKMCKSVGIDYKAFWTVWAAVKIDRCQWRIDKIQEQIEKRLERDGEEMKELEGV